MNWIQIDKMITGLIQAGNDPQDIIRDMKSQFKWTQSQAEHAVMPLVSRTPVLQKKRTKPKNKKPLTKKKK